MLNLRKRKSIKVVNSLIVIIFCFSTIGVTPSRAQMISSQFSGLPEIGSMVSLSSPFSPTLMKGLKVYPDDPFKFDFIVDTQESGLVDKDLKKESDALIKYFLTTLTVPDKDLWVNLSPYEKDRITPEAFGVTQMGRDLLAQDYLLKQITASLMYPEETIGEEFWEKVYAEAEEKFHTTDIPMETFNKVWIVPAKAKIYQNAEQHTVYVVDAKLKVLTEQEYLTNRDEGMADRKNLNANRYTLSTEIIKDIIIPALEKEVNEGEHFALLRQIYHSMILATWYKRNLRESLLSQAYVGKNKVTGVNLQDESVKEKIYQQYLDAFKTGVYNYIKEEYDVQTQQVIPRKYFSGGVAVMDVDSVIEETDDFALVSQQKRSSEYIVSANIIAAQENPVRLRPEEDYALSVDPQTHSVISIENGPTIVTPINEADFHAIIQDSSFVKVDYNPISQEMDARPLSPRNWGYTFFDTPLDYVERNLDVNVTEGIKKYISYIRSSLRKNKKITIVDWGCGGGKVLEEIIKSLEEAGEDLSNIEFVGFSDFYSHAWLTKNPKITFVLDDAVNFEEYFGKGDIDFLISHLGLTHIKQFEAKKEMNEVIYNLLDHEGFFIQDYFIGSVTMTFPDGTSKEMTEWIPSQYNLLRKEKIASGRGVAVLRPKKKFFSRLSNTVQKTKNPWIYNSRSKTRVLNFEQARIEMESFIRSDYSQLYESAFGSQNAEAIDAATYIWKTLSRLDPDDLIPGLSDFVHLTRKDLVNDNQMITALRDPERQQRFIDAIEARILYNQGAIFIEDDYAMSANVDQDEPIKLLPTMKGLNEVLIQPVFLNKFDRELMGYIEDEVTLANGVKIALNWIGINDGIRIDFVSRQEFNEIKKSLRETPQQIVMTGGSNKPFIKSEEEDKISYALPEDVSINEIRYFIAEIHSLMGEGKNRLELTNESARRFQQMAVFLSKQRVLDRFSDPQLLEQYRKNVELLYYLGNLLKTKVDHQIKNFEEIKQMPFDFEDGEAIEDFVEKIKHFLNLSQYKLQDVDAMRWWTRNSLGYIRSMFALAINEKFEHVIFQKGTEEFQNMGTKNTGLYTLKGSEKGDDQTLWSQLPLDEWKDMFSLKKKDVEKQIILDIQKHITRYKGWIDPHKTDYAPYYIKHAQEMNCLGRSTLIARILKEVGIEEERIFLGAYQGHAFLILELADGSYFNIQTYRNPEAKTKEIPEKVLSKYFLSNILKEKRSAFLKVPDTLINEESPLEKSFTVHRITEGLMSMIKVSLLWDIYYRRLELNPESKVELLDFVIHGFERIRLFEPNDYHSIANLAIAHRRKSDAVYEQDKTIGGLRVAIRELNQAIDYQDMVLQFDEGSQAKNIRMNEYVMQRRLLKDELQEKETSYAVNLTLIDEKLRKIPGLDDQLREQFSQYLQDQGLYKYENLLELFNLPTIEYLLSDRSVKPVFLEVLGDMDREQIVPVDQEAVKEIGNGSMDQGMERLRDIMSFRVGPPSEADYLLRLDKDKKIVVGIASNIFSVGKRLNPHGRQSFIILDDRTLIGLKGSGQNLEEESSPVDWDEVKERYNGIMSLHLAQNAQEKWNVFKEVPARLQQFLGYARVHEVPERDGKMVSVDDLLYEGDVLYKPAIAIYRVPTLHRMSEFRRLLSLDPELKNTRKNISKALVSLGRLPEGETLSGDEFIFNMMREFGSTEGYKHNAGLVKGTFHMQDLLLSGDESDNEEFRRARSVREQWNQFRTKVTALSTMIGSIRMYEDRNNIRSALLPEDSTAFMALRELMTSYFNVLDKKHLERWTQKEYKGTEENPWDVVFTDMILHRFHGKATSGTPELLNKKVLKDMKGWAREALAEKQKAQDDYAQVASPDIHRFFHATKMNDLIRMMRIGKIPAIGEEKRVYLNEAKADSPGYFGNIIFYIDREKLDEKEITVYRIAGTPYYESKEDIPFDRITTVENSRIINDPYLITQIDREARELKIQNEPEFQRSRQYLMSVLMPDLTQEERENKISEMKVKKTETIEQIIDRLGESVKVMGLDFKVSKELLKTFVDQGTVIYLGKRFYLLKETDEIKMLKSRKENFQSEIKSFQQFKGIFGDFIQLTEDSFLQNATKYFIRKRSELSEQEIAELIQFSKLLEDTRTFNRVQDAETFSELKNALQHKDEYPFVAQDAAVNARRILTENGFSGRVIKTKDPVSGTPYYYAETEILGETFIVDLAADQFEVAKEADFSKMIFRAEYRDTGIVILPRELIRELKSYESLPMYSTWEYEEATDDFALSTSIDPNVGGIDLSGSQLEIQSTGDALRFNSQKMLENIQDIKGFTPVIFQIVPVTNLPLLLGGKENAAPSSGRDQLAQNK